MSKNPVLKKKFEEGYRLGFDKGTKHGIEQAVNFFAVKFEGLEKVPGIGKKTMEKIRQQLGEHYFLKDDEE
ncbi:hypothetical protein GCM10011409_18800 [Lentibacillus populi]|uniref:Uncharacterized protein n=1 Tax=Lentibacillus populi TaxID=1827502 RepID=A0A9W5TXG8_9BACI|nr:helix-hairpin-helix domain-containing protein [Lentibacillus populi]GGB41522.1 hypothetical protein GCM10011409_18800 [Lentibacillus populi]